MFLFLFVAMVPLTKKKLIYLKVLLSGCKQRKYFDTRPCKEYGEGPVANEDNPTNVHGFYLGKKKIAKDRRFKQKGEIL